MGAEGEEGEEMQFLRCYGFRGVGGLERMAILWDFSMGEVSVALSSFEAGETVGHEALRCREHNGLGPVHTACAGVVGK